MVIDARRIANNAGLSGVSDSAAVVVGQFYFFQGRFVVAYNIDEVVDFDSLTCVAHAMAVNKGWWEGERSAVECWVNFHAELSEAWEEYRCGRMATWYGDLGFILRNGYVPKPEGFWVEIADLMIRIADYFGSKRFDVEALRGIDYQGTNWSDIPAVVHYLHSEMALDGFLDATEICEKFAAAHGVDLYGVIREKLRYNATRPHRHGGKRA